MSPIVEARELRILFPTQDGRATVKAVDGVNLQVMAGETFGVIGESGSGKTTLGRALVSLIKPSAGQVLHGGVDLAKVSSAELRLRRREHQIVFQDPNAALNPRLSILDSVVEPLQIAGSGSAESRQAAALAALSRVGLAREYASRYPHQLSGGQKQRVNIARVLTLRPKLIVCDEVVAALDVSIRGDILNLFADLQRELGLTYVFITHDLSVVSHISDRIAVMYLGRLLELGPTDELSDRPLHPYTQALLSCIPRRGELRGRAQRMQPIPGNMPSAISAPAGCRFHARCAHARPVCLAAMPVLQTVAPDWSTRCVRWQELTQ